MNTSEIITTYIFPSLNGFLAVGALVVSIVGLVFSTKSKKRDSDIEAKVEKNREDLQKELTTKIEKGFTDLISAVQALRDTDSKNTNEIIKPTASEVIPSQNIEAEEQLSRVGDIYKLHIKNAQREDVERKRKKAALKVNKK